MSATAQRRWQIWIDRGGTFTDCIAWDRGSGALRVAKVLSGDDSPLVGIRELLRLREDEPVPACDIRLGTTIATNALLERKGCRCGLVITRGFADLLEIGDQTRPDLFALAIERPPVLYDRVLEVDARASAEGEVLARPDPTAVREALEGWRRDGVESLAVVVLHGILAPALEDELAAIAKDVGFAEVYTSHRAAAALGLVRRADTTVVDAYLTPLLRRYLRDLHRSLPGSTLHLMQSSGGLTDAERFFGRNAVLSGPAGGVVACAEIARAHGIAQAIGFDMGGTSTDVCRIEGEGEPERVFEAEIAGVRVRAPSLAVHTVAAGGGSICRFDGLRFTVGPHSAGADPGPLCYGRPHARELTVTDVNLALGRLLPGRFPFPLHEAPVQTALREVCAALAAAGDERSPEQVAAGFFAVAVENMAQAIRTITIGQGRDVRRHALVVFGGAGGQHACAVAQRLGIRRVLLHPLGGVLSAYGLGVAPVSTHAEADAGRRVLDDGLVERLRELAQGLEARGWAELGGGIDGHGRRARVEVDLRYRGTETALPVALAESVAMTEAFHALHEQTFGYARPQHPIEAVTVRVEVVAASERVDLPTPSAAAASPREARRSRVWLGDAWHDVPVHDRLTLGSGAKVKGPALVVESTSTFVVEPGWVVTVAPDGVLVADDEHAQPPATLDTRRDPVMLEIFSNRLMAIARQMGEVLRRTAISTNIRERRDFSCAVFDARGALVANAPHMPVHLGAMGETVAAIARQHPDARPGDVFVSNDPTAGGSHLPDITVVTPVFVDGTLAFWSASRGHHADVGGITPGSMPPDSKRLGDEGVVFRGEAIVRDGLFDEARVRAILGSGEHPARRPDENVADLTAQIAANRTGERMLLQLVAEHGLEPVVAYMQHLQDYAHQAVVRVLEPFAAGTVRYAEQLDDGTPIAVALTFDAREGQTRLRVDFTGTGPRLPYNLNAPRAVTVAAVLYVLRTLVGEPIPLNAGCLRMVELEIPAGSLLDPGPDDPVAGGNVETAQRLVDVLLAAFGRKAASQGTMNNLTFGDDTFGYYETIAGGEGASDVRDGASGVHTHMTNTQITDPEILESRYPVRLVRFSLRPGSGGSGRHRGGDGVVRELCFLRPLRVSILSDRRQSAPFGLEGGQPGLVGRNLRGGEGLPGRTSFEARAGESLVLETPGGGGFGALPAKPT